MHKLLTKRNSQRSIARVTGVVRATIAELLRKAAIPLDETSESQSIALAKEAAVTPASPAPEAVLELDEMWTFVGRRKHIVWLWLAVERSSQRIISWVLGCRGATTARRLW